MEKNNGSNIIAGFFVGLGLVLLGLFIYKAIIHFKSTERVVSVKGLAEMEVKANIAIWPITFKQVSNDLEYLYKDMEEKQEMLIRFLKDNGFSDEEISVSQMVTVDRQANDYYSERINYRYSSKNTVTVYTDKVDHVREVMKKVDQLGKKGVAIQPQDYDNRTQFLFTKLNEIKPGMVEEATAKGREVAIKFAKDSQSKLGKLKTARQGQFTISNRDSNTPYIKIVRVVVSMQYYLAN
ncbi:MAG: hypothetical protein DRI88_03225 [Bacteroidetes bacterium]|nr:MAG: hypothetical protein DRI72_04095 [Bacteroidota bacterium]RLD48463.1 MAG: hypothetical protein DRI88_03225 [Bacteroidota bacterium]RLD70955.1 MAG: hypothetical protein DRI87_07605 [Bacteroidota bacterium]RLD86006.1 MAG: hypothetical protein DRJ02_09385 [Bacteroidota bacterium]HHL57815.1 SIMPL domain-containing protein [Bacteroidota bacterium]